MAENAIRLEAMQRADARIDPRLDWWRDAKFGLFIHWGLYALPAGIWKGEKYPFASEWLMRRARIPVVEYEQLAATFNPVDFDADAWVRMAKAAGQKYIVITSKHHDGFAMYKSSVSAYNIIDATPFKRDVIAELAEACQKHGLKLGFYYSQNQDWHHPGGASNDWDYVEEEKDYDGYVEHYVKPQVREILTQYGPIALIWFDTPGQMSEQQSRDLLNMVHELQPDCLVSGRVGNGMGDYTSARDNRIPLGEVADFETPATMNGSWGYKSFDHTWKSVSDMLRKLVDITSKGGNYLLNVGPTAQGTIPQASIGRLLAMGAWLEVNGESVYGTRPGLVQGLSWCRSTRRESKLYLHVFDWPEGGLLAVPLVGVTIKRAWLLGDPDKVALPVVQDDGVLVIRGPEQPIDAIDTVVVLEI